MITTRAIGALTLVFGLIAAPAIAMAGDETPVVDHRQDRQEKRIEQGVDSGALNQHEATRLEKGQDRVDAIEQNAKADGQVTRRERVHLQHAENVQSRHIRRQKHDMQ